MAGEDDMFRKLLQLITLVLTAILAEASTKQLLLNTDFKGDELSNWSTLQHAGDKSYEFTAHNGVVTIQRIGTEPWGVLAQRIPLDLPAGEQLQLKAMVRGNFPKDQGEPFQSSSVKLVVQGWNANPALRFLGLQDLLEVTQEIPLQPGLSRWQEVSLDVVIPENAVSVEVFFVMAYEGELHVKAPSLQTMR